MKISAISIIFAFCSLPAFSQERSFRWLEGAWRMRDKNVYEVWQYKDGRMFGKGFEVQGQDTITNEEIQISFFNQSFHFTADVAGDQPPVNFRITSSDLSSFVAENPQHDFPKVIRYTLTKGIDGRDELLATIEGNDRQLSYKFNRLK